MPIFEQSYRSYEGMFRRRFRWVIVLEQELRVLLKSKVMLVLLLAGLLHVFVRVLQIVAYDVISQDPNNPLTPWLQQFQAIVVNERMFYDFVRLQAPLVFVVSLFAGAGMICNDFTNNLMEVYFSKPLSWKDYVLGKVMSIVVLGLALTALPAVFFAVLHNMLMPGMETLSVSWWWPLASIGYSLAIVLPAALAILASSAVLHSQNYAAIAIFMVLTANHIFGGLLAEFLRNQRLNIISFPLAQNRVGQHLFGVRPGFDLAWGWSLGFIGVVCVISLLIIMVRVRRAEIAA